MPWPLVEELLFIGFSLARRRKYTAKTNLKHSPNVFIFLKTGSKIDQFKYNLVGFLQLFFWGGGGHYSRKSGSSRQKTAIQQQKTVVVTEVYRGGAKYTFSLIYL